MPTPDTAFRSQLLNAYLECSTSEELVGWLKDIGQDTRGNAAQKKQRIAENTKYLTMPVEGFPQQTRWYLDGRSSDALSEICQAIGVAVSGTRDSKYRRILREVAYREGWMERPAPSAVVRPAVLQHLAWYPITKRGQYEKDYYAPCVEELKEAFSTEHIYEQLPMSHGSTLRIDVHVGHPQEIGIGIDFKLPSSNADVQRAIGQFDQYKTKYGDDLIIVLLGHELSAAAKTLFLDAMRIRGIAVVDKQGTHEGLLAA